MSSDFFKLLIKQKKLQNDIYIFKMVFMYCFNKNKIKLIGYVPIANIVIKTSNTVGKLPSELSFSQLTCTSHLQTTSLIYINIIYM